MNKPNIKPANPNFSSGPTSKRPGWDITALSNALTGRSHRSVECKARLKEAIDKSKNILGLPEDYLLGIMPGSNTGALEAAMWCLLGKTGVDILAWENFGKDWVIDAISQLKLNNLNIHEEDYGKLPDLSKVIFDNDVIFTWNGTTSGVKVPNGDWIPDNRKGLTICDATSAIFGMPIDYKKCDVITWSWQKILGGEAAHGMIAISPRVVERLESYTPSWPIPKLFRMAENNKLIKGIFEGNTINTPSMICVEDIIKLWDLRNDKYAVQVVQHDYKTKIAKKYWGNKNEDYPRKNWSSVIIWNCSHEKHKILTPNFIQNQTGAFLHRFNWLNDEEIGNIDKKWNWLAMELSLIHI